MTDPLRWADGDVAGPLRRARLRARLTQEQLAEAAGVSVRTIRNLESGNTRARRASLTALSRALDLALPGPQEQGPPWQLPLDTAGFAGRAGDLARLDALLETGGGNVAVVHGTAGVGKTALVVHWAHRVRDDFPDGQLYADLHGYDPAGPAAPQGVLRGFLRALGTAAGDMPDSLDELAALFRSTVAERRMLLVLDNAAGSDQVRALLPGGARIVVVVTGRTPLTALVAATSARVLRLALLGDAEARLLLAARLGSERLERATERAVTTIVDRCAGLPLALTLVAARACVRFPLPLEATADELSAAASLMDVADRWDSDTDLRAVFSWSYRRLSADAARVFRLLGAHFGRDVGLSAAASVAGLTEDRTRVLLAELTAASLVAEDANRRFGMHDLLRAYAARLAGKTDADARTAVCRGLDHYVRTAHRAALLINPGRSAPDPAEVADGVTVEPLKEPRDALRWFEAEAPVLLAGARFAAANGFDDASWRLGWAIVDFLDREGRWHDWMTTQEIALQAARRLPGRAPRAHIHYGLAVVHGAARQFATAHHHLDRAVDLFAEDGDGAREARSRLGRAWLLQREGRDAEALAAAEHALEVMRRRGHRRAIGGALNNVGWAYVRAGRFGDALPLCLEAVAAEREAGTTIGLATALDSLASALLGLGRVTEAVRVLHEAWSICLDLGNRYYGAFVTAHLGDAMAADGDDEAALAHWREAVRIFEDVDPTEADALRVRTGAG